MQFGGQTPLKLAEALEKAQVPILGTSPDAIDLAEDRDRFKQLLDRLKLRQPKSGIATSPEKARAIAESIGYPIVIRPSYVLGGRAMEIVHDATSSTRYVARLAADLDRPSEFAVSDKRPLLIDRYLTDAVEVDVDCLADGKDSYIAGIMEHIEEAGIHSGDSACSLPPHNLSAEVIAELDRQTRALALALKVGGLMNVQYAIKDGDIYVLEVNPRASRTVPFVAKVIGIPAAKIAARIMAGESLASFELKPQHFEPGGAAPCRRQGGGVSVRALRRRGRYRARSGDEIDRRGDGDRPRLQCRLRQKPARRRLAAAENRHRLRLGQGRRQAAHSRSRPAARRTGLPGPGDLGHPALPRREGRRRGQDQQGRRRPAAHRRCHQERRSSAGFQHHRGGHGARRQPFAAARGPLA